MTLHENRRLALLAAAEEYCRRSQRRCALFGFDGYIDSLYAVAERTDENGNQTYFETSNAFLACLAGLNGQSAERELKLKSRKAGGNAPLTAMAAGALGVNAHCVGYIGRELTEFEALRAHCTTTSLGAPAECMALEFANCKWMLSQCESLRSFDAQRLICNEAFLCAFLEAELIALLNWAAMPQNAVLAHLLAERGMTRGKTFFIDFSDVSGLADLTVKQYLEAIRALSACAHVIVGVNLHEAESIAKCLKETCESEEALLSVIERSTGAGEVVLHAMDHAICLERGRMTRCEGYYHPAPVITTGGGDHFNGGYCAGSLAGLDAAGRLALATASALFYVSNGYSGSAEQIVKWLSGVQLQRGEE